MLEARELHYGQLLRFQKKPNSRGHEKQDWPHHNARCQELDPWTANGPGVLSCSTNVCQWSYFLNFLTILRNHKWTVFSKLLFLPHTHSPLIQVWQENGGNSGSGTRTRPFPQPVSWKAGCDLFLPRQPSGFYFCQVNSFKILQHSYS